jgi:hypothetical protein
MNVLKKETGQHLSWKYAAAVGSVAQALHGVDCSLAE